MKKLVLKGTLHLNAYKDVAITDENGHEFSFQHEVMKLFDMYGSPGLHAPNITVTIEQS